MDGCLPGFTNAKCDKFCPGNCLNNTCEQDGGKCQCKPGYANSYRFICDTKCTPRNGVCDPSTGTLSYSVNYLTVVFSVLCTLLCNCIFYLTQF